MTNMCGSGSLKKKRHLFSNFLGEIIFKIITLATGAFAIDTVEQGKS
jgi:hypothetical protein